ncbi:hypothetical protein M7I_6340 [Glarea lozoyensis 74030]|nr:hypothetical protein M7I_6340 [Glarea lozoyensis 74030]
MNSMSLVLVYKLGDVSSPDQVDQVLRSVPADGSPSLRTGEAFTCRIWLKDAIMALDKNQLLKLAAHIDDIEKKAFAAATRLEPAIEEGLIKAKIVSTGSSSSSSSRW